MEGPVQDQYEKSTRPVRKDQYNLMVHTTFHHQKKITIHMMNFLISGHCLIKTPVCGLPGKNMPITDLKL